MYNILIVDDEKNIREGIECLIDWRALGCCVAATAGHGKQALDYLESGEKKIHIILTDIKMPVMDGLELTRIVQEKYPGIQMVILTVYTEFQYAQKAVKYGASDFILKNDFLEEVPASVEKIVARLKSQREPEVLEERVRNTIYRVCACEIKSENDINPEEIKPRLEDFVKVSFPDNQWTFLYEREDFFYIVIEYEPTELPQNERKIERELKKLIQLSETFINLDLSVGISGYWQDYQCVGEGKKEAERKLGQVTEGGQIVNALEVCSRKKAASRQGGIDIDAYMRMLYVTLKDDERKDEYEKILDGLKNYIQNTNRELDQLKADIYTITSYLVRKVRQLNLEEDVWDVDELMREIYLTKTRNHLWEITQKVCMTVQNDLRGQEIYQNSVILEVNRIIRSQYKEKLSLKKISERLFVNSSYLSRIYKKETGTTITDAINIYRVEMAKEMLRKKEHKVFEIGQMVGIEDPAYFTHVFVKYEGQTPSDYVAGLEE